MLSVGVGGAPVKRDCAAGAAGKGGRKKVDGAGALIDLGSREALERFKKAAEAYTKRTTRTPEAALQSLVDAGIYTKSGKVSKHYR